VRAPALVAGPLSQMASVRAPFGHAGGLRAALAIGSAVQGRAGPVQGHAVLPRFTRRWQEARDMVTAALNSPDRGE